MSKNSKLEKIDFFGMRIHESYLPIFSRYTADYILNIKHLISHYPEKNFDGFNFAYSKSRTEGERSKNILYPRIESILDPFTRITLDDIKLIVIFEKPAIFSTGIPFMKSNVYNNANFRNTNLTHMQDLKMLSHLVNDHNGVKVDKLINIHDWYNQGLLCINSTWSNSITIKHVRMWHTIINNILRDILIAKPNILVLNLYENDLLNGLFKNRQFDMILRDKLNSRAEILYRLKENNPLKEITSISTVKF